MKIDISKTSQSLKLKTPDLITRHLGKMFFNEVIKLLDVISEDETVILDFNNIKVIDPSFIDEFLVRLINHSRTNNPPYYIKLKNISDITEINIDLVFKSYSNYKNETMGIITDSISLENRFSIGPLGDTEGDIVEFLRINKIASIEDLIKFTGLSRESIEETTGRLHSLRLIKKENKNRYASV